MGRLATVGRVIEQTLRRFRFAPVDAAWPAEEPDHEMYLKPDYAMCCAVHEGRCFRASQPWVLAAPDDPSWSRLNMDYIRERLGGSGGFYPNR